MDLPVLGGRLLVAEPTNFPNFVNRRGDVLLNVPELLAHLAVQIGPDR